MPKIPLFFDISKHDKTTKKKKIKIIKKMGEFDATWFSNEKRDKKIKVKAKAPKNDLPADIETEKDDEEESEKEEDSEKEND